MGHQPTSSELAPVHNMDDLVEPFVSACKPSSEFRIGAEAEKVGLLEGSFKPVAYDGPSGVVEVMRELVASHGWTVVDDNPLLALEKNGASVTLEPGAQLELSGAPLDNAHLIREEFDAHLEELHAVSEALAARHGSSKIQWFGLGFHPLAAQSELTWVPKPRYSIMRRYLPAVGANGLDMMRRTATVQANYDYSSEEHAMRCLRVGLRTAPFFTAMFANAPFYEGKLFGGKSYRAHVWLDVDSSRQGLVPAVLTPRSTFVDYVNWALDAPMFLVLRDGVVHENTGQSFRSFMKHGFSGLTATKLDWVTHLNSLFPEVRLKRTLEVRGGDSVPSDLVAAPSALFAGLFYDAKALDEVESLVDSFSFEELTLLRQEIPTLALKAPFRGRPAGEVALRILEIARGGLERRGRYDKQGRSEAAHLQALTQLTQSLRSPADRLLDELDQDPSIEAVRNALKVARL